LTFGAAYERIWHGLIFWDLRLGGSEELSMAGPFRRIRFPEVKGRVHHTWWHKPDEGGVGTCGGGIRLVERVVQ
jgi:hypothetical protein